jgi:hypothetical protein
MRHKPIYEVVDSEYTLIMYSNSVNILEIEH